MESTVHQLVFRLDSTGIVPICRFTPVLVIRVSDWGTSKVWLTWYLSSSVPVLGKTLTTIAIPPLFLNLFCFSANQKLEGKMSWAIVYGILAVTFGLVGIVILYMVIDSFSSAKKRDENGLGPRGQGRD
jgi:hypothetical protein